MRTETSPFLALPTELRYAIYRYCLVPSGQIEVVSNYLDGRPPSKVRFYTTYDLSLLEINRKVRAEASELFYADNVFILNSYPRTQEIGQEACYGLKSYSIDYARVHKTHVRTPYGFFPESWDDCIRSTHRIRAFLRGIADALVGSHCMQCMLVQAYEFERIPFCASLIRPMAKDWLGLVEVLQPLEDVRGLQICHIRAMRMDLWPYLRFLERQATKYGDDPQDLSDDQRAVMLRAFLRKEIMDAKGVEKAFGNPDFPHENQIFKTFKTRPLYKSMDFMDLYESDILSEY